jgi:hypothetical protein
LSPLLFVVVVVVVVVVVCCLLSPGTGFIGFETMFIDRRIKICRNTSFMNGRSTIFST